MLLVEHRFAIVDVDLDGELADIEVARRSVHGHDEMERKVAEADRLRHAHFAHHGALGSRIVAAAEHLLIALVEQRRVGLVAAAAQMHVGRLDVGRVEASGRLEEHATHLVVIARLEELPLEQVEERLGDELEVVWRPERHEQLVPHVQERIGAQHAREALGYPLAYEYGRLGEQLLVGAHAVRLLVVGGENVVDALLVLVEYDLVDEVARIDARLELRYALEVVVEGRIAHGHVLHDLAGEREDLRPRGKQVLHVQVEIHGQVVDELAGWPRSLAALLVERELKGQQPVDEVGLVVARVRVEHVEYVHGLAHVLVVEVLVERESARVRLDDGVLDEVGDGRVRRIGELELVLAARHADGEVLAHGEVDVNGHVVAAVEFATLVTHQNVRPDVAAQVERELLADELAEHEGDATRLFLQQCEQRLADELREAARQIAFAAAVDLLARSVRALIVRHVLHHLAQIVRALVDGDEAAQLAQFAHSLRRLLLSGAGHSQLAQIVRHFELLAVQVAIERRVDYAVCVLEEVVHLRAQLRLDASGTGRIGRGASCSSTRAA